jgi:hypothetical protein
MGERSGLQTQSAATLGASLCTPMKNGLRFWNWNRQPALATNRLDELAGFFPNSTPLIDLNPA